MHQSLINFTQENIHPAFYPGASSQGNAQTTLTEDEQIKIAKRIGLIQVNK